MTPNLSPVRPGRKAIFLDIDGTYADHGTVPPGHADAVAAARTAGHLVFLCTGRPISLIFDNVLEAGFDGIVAAAGGYVRLGDEIVEDVRFSADLAHRTLTAMDAHGAHYWAEAPDATYARQSTIDAIAAFWTRHRPHRAGASDGRDHDRARRDVASHLTVVDSFEKVSFAKITSMEADAPLGEIAAEIGPAVAAIPSSIPGLGIGAGELFLAHVHKARGIETVLDRLGVAREDVVAFGDGPNDIEMLEFAATGIAIEGAAPELLAVADGTCAGPEAAGLASAFRELGLITA